MMDINFTGFIPTPTPISLRGNNQLQNIRYFQKQWKCYCFASGLEKSSDEIKRAVLVILIGPEACDFIENRLVLTDEDRNYPERILGALENFFKPKMNVVYERYKFHQATQDVNEHIDTFVSRLKTLVATCDYRERTEEFIRDRLILGIKCPEKNDLINDPELTLQKVVDHVRNLEKKVHFVDLNRLYNEAKNNLEDIRNDFDITTVEHMSSNIRVKIERVDTSPNSYPTPNNSPLLTSSIDSLPPPPKAIKLESTRERIGDLAENQNVVTLSPPPEKKTEPEKKVRGLIIQKPKTPTPGYGSGSFIVAKSDLSGTENPPIWKIDGPALLQKFVPSMENGTLQYKSTPVYSGWSSSSQPLYDKVSVISKNHNLHQKELIVQLREELAWTPTTQSRKRKDP